MCFVSRAGGRSEADSGGGAGSESAGGAISVGVAGLPPQLHRQLVQLMCSLDPSALLPHLTDAQGTYDPHDIRHVSGTS